jgi:N-formylglutamate deformylase
MILHIPHSSTRIPEDIQFDKDITEDIHRMTDWHTAGLFDCDHTIVKLGVSRLVCDVERFIDNEPMDAVGMGICYTVDSFGAPLRTVSDEEKDRIINKYYIPHHAKLYEAVKDELEEHGQVMIVDCHSFSNEQLPHEPSGERADFCIGTDSYHTPVALIARLQKELEILGYTSVLNEPFAGTIVPMEYYHTNDNVKSVMIEVNRSLYMGDMNKYVTIKRIITKLINIINKY